MVYSERMRQSAGTRLNAPRHAAARVQSGARPAMSGHAQRRVDPAQTNARRPSTPRSAGSPQGTARRAPQNPQPPRRATPPRPTAPKPKHTALYALLCLGMAACMAFIGVKAYAQRDAYEHFLEMKEIVENQTFFEGTKVEDVDVSAMTLSEAIDHWKTQIEPLWYNRTVTLDDGTTITALDMGYASDYEEVLTNAWNAGRLGSLEERYTAVLNHQEAPASYRVNRVLYDEDAIAKFVKSIAKQVEEPAQNATMDGFNAEKGEFTFTKEVNGKKLSSKTLRQDIAAAFTAGGGEVKRKIKSVEPEVTVASLKSQYGRISVAVTDASKSNSNRLSNIKQALKYISGTCLEPGATFSFNKVVGKRTSDRGFKIATAYSSGDVTEEIGGGICQVSTTLFNAAVKADLKIVERHNHSLTVAYVDSGKDATVNWDSQDLRFKNTSGEKVYIYGYVTSDKRVRIGIFGRLLENGETITVEAQTTETIEYGIDYLPTDELKTGKEKVISAGKNGCKAIAYKVRWNAAGQEINREVLCTSVYRAKNEVVAVGA